MENDNFKRLISHPPTRVFHRYRFENILEEEITPNNIQIKEFIRFVDIMLLGKQEGLYKYQLLCIESSFGEDNNSLNILLRRISYLFDEVIIGVNEPGVIVKLYNLSDIKLRWEKMHSNFKKNYKGEEIENYLNHINNLLEEEEEVINFLKKYEMYGLYFNEYLGEYNEQIKHKKILEETISDNQILEENIKKYEIKEGNNIIIKMDVSCDDNYLTDKIKSYEGFYLYKENRLIEGLLTIKGINNKIKYGVLCLE